MAWLSDSLSVAEGIGYGHRAGRDRTRISNNTQHSGRVPVREEVLQCAQERLTTYVPGPSWKPFPVASAVVGGLN